jgi:hypothetical protein
MEYLMTYGWSILIIAVVLGTLYSLNVFNSSSLAPTASPGSCKVFRTSASSTLTGVCDLTPQFVAQFNGPKPSAGGAYISLPNFENYQETASNSRTTIFWIYLTAYNFIDLWGGHDANGLGIRAAYSRKNNGVAFESEGCGGYWDGVFSTNAIPLNLWTQISVVRNGLAVSIYYNGTYQAGGTMQSRDFCTTSGAYTIGTYAVSTPMPPYVMANLQIYNTSLDTSQIQALYGKGIGGSPTSLPNLVGWWPLNGNANDYSGNYNNGIPTNVVFTTVYN